MLALIGNTVKTEFAEYACSTREEAEALYMSLKPRAEPVAENGASTDRSVDTKA